MGNFRDVGQEPNSGDCGYFCCYVVYQMMRTGGVPSAMNFAQQQVYAVRDLHRGLATPTGAASSSRHQLGLHDVPLFLARLGVSGYAVERPSRPIPLNALGVYEEVIESLRRPGRSGNHGVILPLGTTRGHYIAALAGDETRWIMYDPSGTRLPEGGRAYAATVPAKTAAHLVASSFIRHIVRPTTI